MAPEEREGRTDPGPAAPGSLSLDRPRRLHVVGVGGVGMSALAIALAGMGHRVSGSDLKDVPAIERVRAAGVEVHLGHDPGLVAEVDAVVVSSAIPATNPELRAALSAGTPVLTRAAALAGVVATRRSIAVAGTHGKTTTTSMVAQILAEAGLHPSFVVGGEVNETGASAAWDAGPWLVVEADESDGTFLELQCEMAVVTNVEADHLDHFGGVPELEAAFSRFLGRAERRVVGADDPVAERLGAQGGATSVGRASGATYRITAERRGRWSSSFQLLRSGDVLGTVELALPGAHNVTNAAMAAAVADTIGVPFEATRAALGRFAGVVRRFQHRGERDGYSVVDDYAHLPGEVRAVLGAARDGGWERVVAVFQPHRYSRTERLWPEFATAFEGADVVVVCDVYPAGEAPRPGISGRLIADAVARSTPGATVRYSHDRTRLAGAVRELLRPGDLCLVLGAGDVTTLVDELLERQ